MLHLSDVELSRWGATFGGYAVSLCRFITGTIYKDPVQDADGNGHGTHVSGTVAGNRYGVAKVRTSENVDLC